MVCRGRVMAGRDKLAQTCLMNYISSSLHDVMTRGIWHVLRGVGVVMMRITNLFLKYGRP